jgi:hypothetical protein
MNDCLSLGQRLATTQGGDLDALAPAPVVPSPSFWGRFQKFHLQERPLGGISRWLGGGSRRFLRCQNLSPGQNPRGRHRGRVGCPCFCPLHTVENVSTPAGDAHIAPLPPVHLDASPAMGVLEHQRFPIFPGREDPRCVPWHCPGYGVESVIVNLDPVPSFPSSRET